MFRFCWLAALGLQTALSAQSLPRESQSVVPLRGATSATVILNMDDGALEVSSGTEYLLRGLFSYPEGEQKPDISYRQSNGDVSLYLRSRSQLEDWRLFLTRQIPIGLELEGGTGPTRLAMSDLRIKRLSVNKDAGGVETRFDGNHPDLEKVSLQQGSGPMQLWMPGTYDNLLEVDFWQQEGSTQAAFGGRFGSLRYLEHEVLGGDVTLDLSGRFPALGVLRVYGKKGQVTLNMSGKFISSLIELKVDSGELLLNLPADVGVIASVKSKKGTIQSQLLEQESDKPQEKLGWLRGLWDKGQGERLFVNEAYGNSPITIRVEIVTVDADVVLHQMRGKR